MFVLAGLGIYKLIERRCPDLVPGIHNVLVLLAFIILLVVVGVLYSGPVFYGLFFVVYTISSSVIVFEVYYRWQIRSRKQLVRWARMIREKPWPPKQKPKFAMAVFSILLNLAFALASISAQPADFNSFFLVVLVTNLTVSLFYYIITKCLYREVPSWRPALYFILAFVIWMIGIFFYTRAVTNWLEPPAVSRNGNRECIVLGFFDAHDMWHFLSAFALFFSFLMLMTLDDGQRVTPRNKLRVF